MIYSYRIQYCRPIITYQIILSEVNKNLSILEGPNVVLTSFRTWLEISKFIERYFWKSSVPCHVGYFRPKNKDPGIFESHLNPVVLV